MSSRTLTGRNTITAQPLCITVEDGRIRAIEPGPEDEALWLAPGLIDLQVNGYGGCDLNADAVDADVVLALTRQMLSTGVTTFVPTLITAPEEKIVRALRAIAKAREASALVAYSIPFVHVEGPHISPEEGAHGAHAPEYIRPPSLDEFARWQAASGDLVGTVTVSPHWENAAEYIAALAGKGVRVAIGHTHAAPEQIHAAAAAGASLSTHLGNGIALMLPRHPNPIWAQLADERLTATFIADGHHMPADTLKAMLRAKGIERSIFVSDAVALAGMPPGIYDAPVGGRVQLSADGRANVAGTDILAGAVRPLKDGVAWATVAGVCGLGDAIRMATEIPGRQVGRRGLLRLGETADLVRFALDAQNKSLQIETVLVEGVEER
ncbi:MAG: amidohydrolase family protein [Terracidiphilus sp.]|nr:amidohydrolase family protein [Terracidiphilus sp.]